MRRTNESEDDEIDVEAHRKSNLGAADEGGEAEEPDFELHRKSNLN